MANPPTHQPHEVAFSRNLFNSCTTFGGIILRARQTQHHRTCYELGRHHCRVNQADFAACVQFVQNHLDNMDPKKGVSWPTMCYMLGEVQYGGCVTDDFDKHLLTTFTQVWFCDVLLRPGFEFCKGYKVPQTRNLQGNVDYINSLPLSDTPEVFGLHGNADITYQINTAKGLHVMGGGVALNLTLCNVK